MLEFFNLQVQYARFPNVKREEVQKLVQWFRTQSHMPPLSEQEVFIFYYACNCSMEYAKQVIDLNYTMRSQYRTLFGNMDIETAEVQQMQKTVAGFPMTRRTAEGYLVVFGKLADMDPSNFHFLDGIKLFLAAQDMWLLKNGTIPGVIVAIDMTGASLGHIARCNILHAKNVLQYIQEALPCKIVGIHVLNTSSLIDKILAIFGPFIKKKLFDLLHFHTSPEPFYKIVAQEWLPCEYGGKEISTREAADIFFKELNGHRFDLIEYSDSRCVNEKLRSGKPKIQSELLGTEGSFKKLEFD